MAERVYTTPLLDKLGVRPGMRVAIVGDIAQSVIGMLTERTDDITVGEPLDHTDVVLMAADSPDDLGVLSVMRSRIRQAGAIWVISRKGKSATLRDTDVIAAGRAAHLVDNKVASFSDTHTALRLVIPRALRTIDAPTRQTPDPAARLRLGAVVLAAGAARRFGGHKLTAELHGRPLLQHVLDTLAVVPLVRIVVVMAGGAKGLERISWQGAVRVVNPDPARGLSSSLRIGLEACAISGDLDGAFILLGDQPLTAASTLAALSGAAPAAIADGAEAVAPDYAGGGGANPVLLLRAGFPRVASITGDRGLGSVLAARPELVYRVPLQGSNPDVDTLEDLRALQADA